MSNMPSPLLLPVPRRDRDPHWRLEVGLNKGRDVAVYQGVLLERSGGQRGWGSLGMGAQRKAPVQALHLLERQLRDFQLQRTGVAPDEPLILNSGQATGSFSSCPTRIPPTVTMRDPSS